MNFRVFPSFTQVTYRKYRSLINKSNKQGFHLIYLLNNKFNAMCPTSHFNKYLLELAK